MVIIPDLSVMIKPSASLPLNFTYLSLSTGAAPGEGTVVTLILIGDNLMNHFSKLINFQSNINFIQLNATTPNTLALALNTLDNGDLLFMLGLSDQIKRELKRKLSM